jgi:CBS domain-containing protein
MEANSTQLAASLEPLALHSFEAFCEDIVSMFGNAAECAPDSAGQGSLDDLKKVFNKLASVNHVQSLGMLEGTFQLFLDQAGLFVLAGIFVMLPEKRINETIRNGTLKDADYINDAIKEVGNLLVGSWDRIFRAELKGHKHLKQTGTFVGPIWEKPEESIGLSADQACSYVICKMKVDNFPEFKCAAVFSEQFSETKTETSQTQGPEPAGESELKTQVSKTPDAADKPIDVSEPNSITDSALELPLNNEEPIKTVSPEPISNDHNPGPVTEAIRQLTRQSDLPAAASTDDISKTFLPTLTVGQIMTQAVLWVDPEDTVEDVLRQMQQQNVGYALAGRDGQIEGIVSRSDIAAAVSPYTRSVFSHWRRPLDDASLQIRIKWFMSRLVQLIRPEASLPAAMETMMRHSVRGLPVVDSNGQTLGLVTVFDVFGALLGSVGISITGRPQQAPPGIQ